MTFNELNSSKVDRLVPLIFLSDEDEIVAGIILGEKDGLARSPFSAPYGGITICKELFADNLRQVAEKLLDVCHEKGLDLLITFPSRVCDDRVVVSNRLFSEQLTILGNNTDICTNVNHHIPLDLFPIVDHDILRRKFRAEEAGVQFRQMETSMENFQKVYEVIRENHVKLGYPVRMTLEDYLKTSAIVSVLLFGCFLDDEILSGAICYVTRTSVVQLISWGDRVELREKLPTMPKLGFDMMSWMKTQRPDLKVIDLGPSASDGFESKGLSHFKESLGAVRTLKNTFFIKTV